LEHGLWRADTPRRAQQRRVFLDQIYAVIPIHPFTKETAQLAAKIDAQTRRLGNVIPLADLQIGGTALHLGFELVTLNVRHFQMIPDLVVRGSS
jgi:predicted nucleic acid-binding protein